MDVIEYKVEYQSQLEQIYLQARQETFLWMDTQQFKITDFVKDTEGEKIWLAEDETGVLGFISVWPEDYFIHHLYVSKTAQRKGVGKKLLDTASQYFQHAVSLKCLSENKNAIHFYRSQGFKTLSQGYDLSGDYLFMQRSAV